MKRTKTKTSSFGTSKREGHDATQFYSSNLYQGFKVIEDRPIIDNSSSLPVSLHNSTLPFSVDKLRTLPDYSIHLLIMDLRNPTNPFWQNGKINYKTVESLLQEFMRLLITGGKLVILLDNSLNNDFQEFHPNHAIILPILLNVGFIMRGETLWLDPPNKPPETLQKSPGNSNIISIYQHILIFSKDILKRNKNGRTDTISRDQFLSYTKSIWKPQPELLQNAPTLKQIPEKLTDLYNHLLHLFSFQEDTILFIFPQNLFSIKEIGMWLRKVNLFMTFS